MADVRAANAAARRRSGPGCTAVAGRRSAAAGHRRGTVGSDADTAAGRAGTHGIVVGCAGSGRSRIAVEPNVPISGALVPSAAVSGAPISGLIAPAGCGRPATGADVVRPGPLGPATPGASGPIVAIDG